MIAITEDQASSIRRSLRRVGVLDGDVDTALREILATLDAVVDPYADGS